METIEGNVIKVSIRALILEETLLKKGFFQAIFLKAKLYNLPVRNKLYNYIVTQFIKLVRIQDGVIIL